MREFPVKSDFTFFQNGNDLILRKAAFHIFMHAVHTILSRIFTSLQTLYSSEKTLYLCAQIALTSVTNFIFCIEKYTIKTFLVFGCGWEKSSIAS